MLKMNKRSKQVRILFALVLFVLVTGGVLSACGSPTSGLTAPPTAAPPQRSFAQPPSQPQATSAPAVIQTPVVQGAPKAAPVPPDQSVGGSPNNLVPIDRRIIKNAQLSEMVEDTDTA